MISFFVCLVVLIISYFTYGKFMERVLKINPNSSVPSQTKYDGLDYIPMPVWKTFLIQFLNIAGLGPIFGAVLGAAYGPVAFLWITLGGIFLGAVQDFASGTLSVRNDGMNFPDLVGKYLGMSSRQAMRIFTLLLMILVGTVFMSGPAAVLAGYLPIDKTIWLAIIFCYYILATILPIDKIIGKIYPIFGAVLFIMAILMFYVLIFDGYGANLSEITFENMKPDAGNFPIIPTMLITIACGAISGFHTTQSPLMARCMNNEKECRPIFFGTMICESIIALIWAAIAMAFFGSTEGLNKIITETGGNAATIIDIITSSTLGKVGVAFVILGVVFAPITTGDTAFRMARLITSDFVKLNQKTAKNRIVLSLPIFIIAFFLTQINFDIIWRYFAWFNQVLAVFALWTVSAYLRDSKYLLCFVAPAIIMTFVVTLYILFAKQGFSINYDVSAICAAIFTVATTALFFWKKKKTEE